MHHVIGDGWSVLKIWEKVFTTRDVRPGLQGAPVQTLREEGNLSKQMFSGIKTPHQLVKLFRSLSKNRGKIPKTGKRFDPIF